MYKYVRTVTRPGQTTGLELAYLHDGKPFFHLRVHTNAMNDPSIWLYTLQITWQGVGARSRKLHHAGVASHKTSVLCPLLFVILGGPRLFERRHGSDDLRNVQHIWPIHLPDIGSDARSAECPNLQVCDERDRQVIGWTTGSMS